jgi:drug/metabolite transporter (DMT)-like permease
VDQQTKAYSFALVSVLMWATVATAFKLALRSLTPSALLLYASLVASVTLFLVLVAQRRLHALSQLTFRDWLSALFRGFLNPFLYYTLLFRAYALLPGQEAQPLNYTWAIALAILSIPLLKQPIRAGHLLAIFISFTGVYVIATRGDLLSFRFTQPLGVSLALGSSVVWALFWIFNLRDPQDEVIKLCLSFFFGFVLTLGYCILTGQDLEADRLGAGGAIYTGLVEMGLTFVLWLKALKLSRTTAQVSNLIFLAPFVSLVLLHLVAGEQIYLSSVAGLALIVVGIAFQKRLG